MLEDFLLSLCTGKKLVQSDVEFSSNVSISSNLLREHPKLLDQRGEFGRDGVGGSVIATKPLESAKGCSLGRSELVKKCFL